MPLTQFLYRQNAPVGKTQISPALNNGRLDNLVKKSQRILASVSSVFPFDFFPDTITVDETKIVITRRLFLGSNIQTPLLLKNIFGINVIHSPLFASLFIEMDGIEKDPDPIHYLWPSDADLIRRLVVGLLACDKEGINTSDLNIQELVSKVSTIGALH